MEFTGGNLLFSFLAGTLTTLSPCVLPVLPLIVGSSVSKDRLAPAFVGAGLAVSFVAVGWSIASFGTLLGAAPDSIRTFGAVMLGFFGLAFLSSHVGGRLALNLEPLSHFASEKLAKIEGNSRLAHFGIGLLLGAVWSPCSGPTLGAAVSLAAQEGSGIGSLVTMSFFAFGAVLPLGLAAYGAGGLLRRNQHRLNRLVVGAKTVLGLLMITISALVLTGLDKQLESIALNILPASWAELTVRF